MNGAEDRARTLADIRGQAREAGIKTQSIVLIGRVLDYHRHKLELRSRLSLWRSAPPASSSV